MSDYLGVDQALSGWISTLGGRGYQYYENTVYQLSTIFKNYLGATPGILRKISVVRDKELKNRPIAIFDY